jgi:hypothetical protein
MRDVLEWREQKVQDLIAFSQNTATKVEEILDYYSLDQFGKRMHNFLPGDDPSICRICEDTFERHNEFQICTICLG